MAVAIRLSRGGAKKRPYYKIVVTDARNARDGKFIERIGSYNPLLPKDSPEREAGRGSRPPLALGRRPAVRPGPSLPRPGRSARAPGPQQPEEGRSRRQGEGARRG